VKRRWALLLAPALALAALPSAVASGSATFVVRNTNDAGPDSLRAAIQAANATPDADTIRFNIPGAGPHTIAITSGALPKLTAPVTINGQSQPGFSGSPLVGIDNQTGNPIAGLHLTGGQSKVTALGITGFSVGIHLAAGTASTVGGNWIGLDPSGGFRGNTQGVLIDGGSTGNTIGGTSPGLQNSFTANATAIAIRGSGTDGNLVQGNRIGGRNPGETSANTTGIEITDGASGNTIGGTSPGARNVVSGNDANGIELVGPGTTGNVVEGNYVGIDVGVQLPPIDPVRNAGVGILVAGGASGNTIGGPTAGARNVISASGADGVAVVGNARNTTIQGNLIGTDPAGRHARRNGNSGIRILLGSSGNTIDRNVSSGNGVDGVTIADPGSTGNVVTGNLLGVDASGLLGLPNENTGLSIESGATANTIGGTTVAARNVISGNPIAEVAILNPQTKGNVVEGNYLGTDANGELAIDHAVTTQKRSDGVSIADGASANTIGGTAAGAGNLISGNFPGSGVQLSSAGAGNRIQGNVIGLNAAGTRPLFNRTGVFVDTTPSTLIGGATAGAGNVVSGNGSSGVELAAASQTSVQGNVIGTDPTGAIPLGNVGAGVLLTTGSSSNTIGGPQNGAGNTIAFNASAGVALGAQFRPAQPAGPHVNQPQGNSILRNAIYSNTGDGIVLAPDANGNEPAPTIAELTTSGATTKVTIALVAGAPSVGYRLELFTSPTCDPSGAGEGKRFVTSKLVTTDGGGNASLTFGVPALPADLAATATSTNASSGSTSEFSTCAPTS